jgi:hypothetical protein
MAGQKQRKGQGSRQDATQTPGQYSGQTPDRQDDQRRPERQYEQGAQHMPAEPGTSREGEDRERDMERAQTNR